MVQANARCPRRRHGADLLRRPVREGRLAKLELSEAERPRIDPDFEEVTEGEEVERKEGLKSKWAQLAAYASTSKPSVVKSESIAQARLIPH
jgi:hypothetical protein